MNEDDAESRTGPSHVDDGWRLIDDSDGVVFDGSFGPVTVRALERTDVYEYVDLAEALAEAFDADGSPAMFFASRIDIRPAIDGLPGGIGRDRLMEEVHPAARAAFRGQLAASGLDETIDGDDADALATEPETFAEAVDALLVSVE